MIELLIQTSNELYHHGIRGQKWGIRRYQKYDGSLTQKGVKRYYESKEKYDAANEKYQKAKAEYKADKNAAGAKTKLTNARLNKRVAERKMNKDYRHLKEDKRADKGKELYSKGYTITGKKRAMKALALIGGLAVSAAIIEASGGQIPIGNGSTYEPPKAVRDLVRNHSKDLVVGGSILMGAAAAGSAVTANKDRNLRAYYKHTSNY